MTSEASTSSSVSADPQSMQTRKLKKQTKQSVRQEERKRERFNGNNAWVVIKIMIGRQERWKKGIQESLPDPAPAPARAAPPLHSTKLMSDEIVISEASNEDGIR